MNTKRFVNLAASAIMLCFFVSLFVCMATAVQADEPVLIAVAANMQPTMEYIETLCEKECSVEIDLVFGSSGALATNIRSGAPFDIYVAANMKYPRMLHEEGYAVSEPVTYATGKLALWTVAQSGLSEKKMKALLTTADSIAMPDPAVAPYGVAAIEAMKTLALDAACADNYVYGKSISQANHFITSKAAEIGFTSLSTIKNPAVKITGSWMEVDSTVYTPIKQGLIMVKENYLKHTESVRRVYEYLLSGDMKEALITFGYGVS